MNLYFFPSQALAKSASTGAMTFSFIQAVERREAMTYAGLLSSMRNSIRRANSGSRGVTDLIGMLLSGGSFPGGALTQVSCSSSPCLLYLQTYAIA